MRVMLFHNKADSSDEGMEPTPEMQEAFAAMDAFTEELVKAGVFVAGAGLKPIGQSRRIEFDGRGKRNVIDGPFAEGRELIAGFSIWEVKDIDEALAWVMKIPDVPGKGAIEIRPFYEAADLEGFATPEEIANPRGGERGKLGVA